MPLIGLHASPHGDNRLPSRPDLRSPQVWSLIGWVGIALAILGWADIALGAFARRWFGVEGVTKPKQPNMARWFAQFSQRPGFVKFIAPPMS